MVLFRITENEPSKMHNVRPYVYSRPCSIDKDGNVAQRHRFCPKQVDVSENLTR